jgi:hypothetical protein
MVRILNGTVSPIQTREKFSQGHGYIHTLIATESTGRDHADDVGVDRRIILEWILGKQGWKMWTGFIWLRIRTSGGLL